MSETTLGDVANLVGGPAERQPVRTQSVRDVVEQFAGGLACSALDRVEQLLDERVAVRTPGRSRLAGDHRGRQAAMAALSAAPVDGVRLAGTRVTEILVDDDRGLVVLELVGAESGVEFRFEVAFHLVIAGERIVGITEYSADQYTADRLLGVGSDVAAADAAKTHVADSADRRTRSRRWWGRR